MSCRTAMMSARGTMTFMIRRSRSPRMFRSMVRSAGEKPNSPACVSKASLRSARVVLGFQPKIVRSARANQLFSGAGALGCGTGTGRLRVAPAAGSLEPGGSGSGIAMLAPGVACKVGIGHPELGEDRGFESLHDVGPVVGLVIVAGEMEKSVHRQMRQVMRKRFALGARFTVGGLVRDHDVAEQARS